MHNNFGCLPRLKLLGVNTVAKARKTKSVITDYFQIRNYLKVLGVKTLATSKKTESVNT